jgi:NAD(P)-dependent dehydrogenase (short-subunit alcohol dehydrogenase family)
MSIVTPFGPKTTAAQILDGVDLAGRTALVTGGTSGLGAATAHALEQAGAKVTATTRKSLDLGDLESVRAFTRAWEGPVDILVANAGIMAVPERRITAEGWELQLATNFLGHFTLVTGLHEHLREGARIVTVSSGIQSSATAAPDFGDLNFERRPYDPWVAYGQSKVADILLAVGITQRWGAEGIAANALSPGYIHTNLQRHLDDSAMRSMGAMDEAGNLLTPDYYKTPEQGAATSVLLAASPLLEGVSGRYFEDNQEHAAAPWSLDQEAAEKLWTLAATTVGPVG